MSSEEYLLSLLTKPIKCNHAQITFINQRLCPLLKYYKDRLSIKYIAKGTSLADIISIQTNNPALKEVMIYYYEAKIMNLGSRRDITIGYANVDFPLNKFPGCTRKSYGYRSDGNVYSAKQTGELVMPKFTTGCYIGCGINYAKNEIFFTFNGNYYAYYKAKHYANQIYHKTIGYADASYIFEGKHIAQTQDLFPFASDNRQHVLITSIRLGPAFKNINLSVLYPTIGLHSENEHVTLNFGLKPFKFDLERFILTEKEEIIKKILKIDVDYFALHEMIQSYLYFHGYHETLQTFEQSAKLSKENSLLLKDLTRKPQQSTTTSLTNGEKISYNDEKSDTHEERSSTHGNQANTIKEKEKLNMTQTDQTKGMEIEINKKEPNEVSEEDPILHQIITDRMRSESFQMEFESPVFNNMTRKDSYLTDMGDFSLNQESSIFEPLAKRNSLMLTSIEEISSMSELSNDKINHAKKTRDLFQNRSYLRKQIQQGNIQDAISHLNKLLPSFLTEHPQILKALHAQQYIEYLRTEQITKAIEYAQNNLHQHQDEILLVQHGSNLPQEISINALLGLICYNDPGNSELKDLLSFKQREFTADIVNKAILKKLGYLDECILSMMMSHLAYTDEKFKELNDYYGEVFNYKI